MTLPITETEKAALTKLGYLTVGMPSAVLEAYRAGFAEGAAPLLQAGPQSLQILELARDPRVFRLGDDDPGSDVEAVIDHDGDVWVRAATSEDAEWSCAIEIGGWVHMLSYGPLVALPVPDYAAAVAADEQRRATKPKEHR